MHSWYYYFNSILPVLLFSLNRLVVHLLRHWRFYIHLRANNICINLFAVWKTKSSGMCEIFTRWPISCLRFCWWFYWGLYTRELSEQHFAIVLTNHLWKNFIAWKSIENRVKAGTCLNNLGNKLMLGCSWFEIEFELWKVIASNYTVYGNYGRHTDSDLPFYALQCGPQYTASRIGTVWKLILEGIVFISISPHTPEVNGMLF